MTARHGTARHNTASRVTGLVEAFFDGGIALLHLLQAFHDHVDFRVIFDANLALDDIFRLLSCN
jgi:hypothetical protein